MFFLNQKESNVLMKDQKLRAKKNFVQTDLVKIILTFL